MITLDEHIEAERKEHPPLTPREIGFIERAWKAAGGKVDEPCPEIVPPHLCSCIVCIAKRMVALS